MNANWQYSTDTPAAAALQPVELRHCPPRVAKYISPRLAQTTSCRAQRNAGSSVLYTCPDTPATHRHSANAHAAPALRIGEGALAAATLTLSAVRHGPKRPRGLKVANGPSTAAGSSPGRSAIAVCHWLVRRAVRLRTRP